MCDFWLTFPDGAGGYVGADTALAAGVIAERVTGNRPVEIQPIPYPAHPILSRGAAHPEHGHTPPFCFDPHNCAGLGACPKARACSE